jgi:hypothetical protein
MIDYDYEEFMKTLPSTGVDFHGPPQRSLRDLTA